MEMKEIQQEVAKLGNEIETAKQEVSQLKGRKEEILKRLKEEFGVSSLEEAETLLDKEVVKLEELETKIKADFEELKGLFSW